MKSCRKISWILNTLPNGVRLAREMPFILHKMAWEYWRILNTLPNEVTHLTLAPALTLHTNVLVFTFVNCNLRKISSDKVTHNILIINDLTCHLSLALSHIEKDLHSIQFLCNRGHFSMSWKHLYSARKGENARLDGMN